MTPNSEILGTRSEQVWVAPVPFFVINLLAEIRKYLMHCIGLCILLSGKVFGMFRGCSSCVQIFATILQEVISTTVEKPCTDKGSHFVRVVVIDGIARFQPRLSDLTGLSEVFLRRKDCSYIVSGQYTEFGMSCIVLMSLRSVKQSFEG